MEKRFKVLRKCLGFTQKELGDILGITGSAVSDIENRRAKLSSRNIKLICDKLNINEVWLITGQGEMFRQKTNEDYHVLLDEILKDKDLLSNKLVTGFLRMKPEHWKMLEELLDIFIQQELD